MEPNALPENGVEAAEAVPPNTELPEEAPKELGAEPSPVPNAAVELNGELVVAGTLEVEPKGDLFCPPPPNADVLDVGAVVADETVDADDPLGTVVVEPKEDLLADPPKGDVDAPTEADMFPKPNDVFADDGGAGLSSNNGFDVLYFCANLSNMPDSLPLYFSSVLATSGSFCTLCFS